jgi:ribokinase
MGGRGSVLATRSEPDPVSIPADPVDRVVDTTGAGDAFVGALAFYLCHFPDLKMSEMIRRSGSIASISVQSEGTQTSFPFKEDLPVELFQSS